MGREKFIIQRRLLNFEQSLQAQPNYANAYIQRDWPIIELGNTRVPYKTRHRHRFFTTDPNALAKISDKAEWLMLILANIKKPQRVL
jgi:hypothetical protein